MFWWQGGTTQSLVAEKPACHVAVPRNDDYLLNCCSDELPHH